MQFEISQSNTTINLHFVYFATNHLRQRKNLFAKITTAAFHYNELMNNVCDETT